MLEPTRQSDGGSAPIARADIPPASLSSFDEPPPLPDSKSGRPWGFWATIGLSLGIFVTWVAAQAVVLFLWFLVTKNIHRRTTQEDLGSDGLLIALSACGSVPVVLGLAYLFAWIRVRVNAGLYLGFRTVPLKALLRWTAALLALILISDTFTVVFGRSIVPPFMVKAYTTAGFLPLLWLAVLVAAPLAEETLFRGFLFEGLRHSKAGASGAVIFSSIWWASIHFQYDLVEMATVFVLGLFLGCVRLRTQSLIATMYLHGFSNLIATLEVAAKVRFDALP